MSEKQLTPKGKEDADEKIIVDEVELKTIEVRLTSVKDAAQRSRFIFIIMTVISSAILLVIWNITFSWDKRRAFSPKFEESNITVSVKEVNDRLIELNRIENFNPLVYEKIEKLRNESKELSSEIVDKAILEASKEITEEKVKEKLKTEKRRIWSNQDEVISEWIKNRVISIGLLGIRINAPDLSVIGSLSLTIITIWFFFSARRENRAIVTLLRDIYEDWRNRDVNLDVCKMVYYGIVNSLVFIDMGGGDKPIGGLRKIEQDIPSVRVRLLISMIYKCIVDKSKQNISLAEENQEKEIEAKQEPIDKINMFFLLLLIRKRKTRKPFIRKIISVLAYLPPITIIVIIASDIYSLSLESPFRDFHKSLWDIINETRGWSEAIRTILILDGIAFLAFLCTAWICKRCRQFSKKSADTIIEFRKKTRVE